MQLTVTGFNDKLPEFLSSVVKLLKEFRPEEKNFLRFKDILRREFESWKTQQPYSHASYYANLASESYSFEIDTLVTALESTTINSLTTLLPTILDTSFGTVLAIGNMNELTALSMVKTVETAFPFVPLPRSERCVKNAFEYPMSNSDTTTTTTNSQGIILRNQEPNENDSNSAVSFYFQQPSLEKKDYLLLELLSDVIEQPFYNSLRTQQQLGYIVYSGVKVRHGIYHLTFTVQSSIVNGDELVKRIEQFLSTEIPKVARLNKKSFEEFRSGLLARKSEPDRRLTSQASRFLGEILFADARETRYSVSGVAPDFNRYEEESKILASITVDEFRSYAQSFLSPNKRRLLISQIDAQKRPEQEQGGKSQKKSKSSDVDIARSFKYKEIRAAEISDFRGSLPPL
jgi:insulysin